MRCKKIWHKLGLNRVHKRIVKLFIVMYIVQLGWKFYPIHLYTEIWFGAIHSTGNFDMHNLHLIIWMCRDWCVDLYDLPPALNVRCATLIDTLLNFTIDFKLLVIVGLLRTERYVLFLVVLNEWFLNLLYHAN